MMIGILVGIWHALIPPMGADEKGLFQHRVAIAALTGGAVMGTIVHIAWACGFLSTWGIAGFALASDLETIRTQMTVVQAQGVKTQYLEARRNECQASEAQNGAAMRSWYLRRVELAETLADLTRRTPDVPPCELFRF